MASGRHYFDEYIRLKAELDKKVFMGEGESKLANQLRTTLINCWNRMPPQQQRDIANRFIQKDTNEKT